MKFHHIGIATENIDDSIKTLSKVLNINTISECVFDKNQNANLCMITIDNGIRIELISGQIVENIVKKRKYLYHTCYSTDDINQTIDKLINLGAVMVSEPKEAILFNNKKVCFLMWDLGLIELVECDD